MKKNPEETRIVGDFGEYILAYFLTKKGLNVIMSDTVFFDLIVKDTENVVFPEKKIIGISVKTRDRTSTTSSCTIQHKDFKKIESYGNKWSITPYICHIIIFKDKKQNKRILEAFIFSFKDAKKYFAEGKRKYAISFSKLRENKGKIFIEDKNYFLWRL